MRLLPGLLLALLVLSLVPQAAAQDAGRVVATLAIDVHADRSETMSLSFAGLKRLTEYQRICLPAGATPTRVHDDLGDMPHEKAREDDRYVLTFRARGETVAVTMTRGAPDEDTAPFYEADANFCVPEGSESRVRVRVPQGHEIFFLSRGGEIADDGREATVRRDGPLHVFYAYEAPLENASGLRAVDVAPFHVVVPADLAEQARAVAELAGPALASAAREAGLDMPWERLRVRYAPATELGWEAGHYGGHGLITIKQSTLDPSPREGYPYAPTKVLVHESFHALSVPYGRGEVQDAIDWWLEGTARHAERHVDRVLPNATRHCERSATEIRCWSFDDRITRDALEQAYAPGFTFERRWSPSLEQSDDTRSFYYQYSAYLAEAYLALHGADAYRDAWNAMQTAFHDPTRCPCLDGWLEKTLLQTAGGDANVRDLYRPWNDLHFADKAAFDLLVTPFVKDEQALQDELEKAAGWQGLLVPGPGVLLVLLALLVVLAVRRRGG